MPIKQYYKCYINIFKTIIYIVCRICILFVRLPTNHSFFHNELCKRLQVVLIFFKNFALKDLYVIDILNI